jgi:hypothetical protein
LPHRRAGSGQGRAQHAFCIEQVGQIDALRAIAASSGLSTSPSARLNLMPLRSSGMWLPVTISEGMPRAKP